MREAEIVPAYILKGDQFILYCGFLGAEDVRRTCPRPLQMLDANIDAWFSRLVGLGLSPEASSRPDVAAIVLALEHAQRVVSAHHSSPAR